VVGLKRGRSPGSENSLRKEEDRWPRTTGESCISHETNGCPSDL